MTCLGLINRDYAERIINLFEINLKMENISIGIAGEKKISELWGWMEREHAFMNNGVIKFYSDSKVKKKNIIAQFHWTFDSIRYSSCFVLCYVSWFFSLSILKVQNKLRYNYLECLNTADTLENQYLFLKSNINWMKKNENTALDNSIVVRLISRYF